MTYISVVMNPVSSERKRKKMKRQQQMETGRKKADAQLRGGGTDGGGSPPPPRKAAYREGDRGPDPAKPLILGLDRKLPHSHKSQPPWEWI